MIPIDQLDARLHQARRFGYPAVLPNEDEEDEAVGVCDETCWRYQTGGGPCPCYDGEIFRPGDGPQVHVLGLRVHHGAVGFLLIALGSLLAAHDWADRKDWLHPFR